MIAFSPKEKRLAASHLPGLHMAIKSREDGAKSGSGGGVERLDEDGQRAEGRGLIGG